MIITRMDADALIAKLRGEAEMHKSRQDQAIGEAEMHKSRHDQAIADALGVARAYELFEAEARGRETDKDNTPPKYKVEDYDFSGAKNLPERCRRVALQNNGVVNANASAELFLAAGTRNGKKNHLVSGIFTALQQHEDWSKEGEASTFRWLRFVGHQNGNLSPQPELGGQT